jgi:hypothetical protein
MDVFAKSSAIKGLSANSLFSSGAEASRPSLRLYPLTGKQDPIAECGIQAPFQPFPPQTPDEYCASPAAKAAAAGVKTVFLDWRIS